MMDILFVDDDQNILSGLRRQMRSDRTKWNCHFANSGQEALQKIPGSAIKVVITDLKMPGMPGLDLLKRVKDNWPHMTRVVLSGEVDGGVVLRALGYAHRLVSKP
jgi:YesN/AraC family two-component response regulator